MLATAFARDSVRSADVPAVTGRSPDLPRAIDRISTRGYTTVIESETTTCILSTPEEVPASFAKLHDVRGQCVFIAVIGEIAYLRAIVAARHC